MASAAVTGRVAASADRVGLTQTLLDQEVVKQPYRNHSLLQGGIGQTHARVDRHHVRTPATGPLGQFPYVACDVGSVGPERLDSHPLAHLQVLGQPASVGVQRPGRTPQIGPHAKPDRPPARAGPAPATSPPALPCPTHLLSPWSYRSEIVSAAARFHVTDSRCWIVAFASPHPESIDTTLVP